MGGTTRMPDSFLLALWADGGRYWRQCLPLPVIP